MVIDELAGKTPTEKNSLFAESLGDFDAALLVKWIKDNNAMKTLE